MTTDSKRMGVLDSLILLLATFVPALIVLFSHPTELHVRSIGGGFQLLGIAIIAFGIRELRVEFSVPKWRDDIRAELAPLWASAKSNWGRWWGKRSHTHDIAANVTMTAGLSAIVTRGEASTKKITLSERVNLLAAEVQTLKAGHREVKGQIARHSEEVTRDFAAEAERRAEMKAELTGMITSLAVGGLRMETVGIYWLLAGTILATWPCEIAGWLGVAC